MICKRIFFLVVGLLFALVANAQPYKGKEILTKIGFTYFSINDTCQASTCDSIRFVVRKPVSGNPKPLLLFIQGSGNGNLFYKGEQSVYSFITSFEEDSLNLISRYVFAVISKPFTPIVADSVELGKVYDESKPDYAKFRREDKQSYYVSSAEQVIEFLAHQPFVDSSRIYVMGHSQGYEVAAKLAAQYPRLIKKVVCLSSGLFDRESGFIRQIREQEHSGAISPDRAQAEIDSIYTQYNNLKGYVDQELAKGGSAEREITPYLNNYSFDYAPSLDNFLKIKIPILVVYGTDDPVSSDNDLLPLFFTRAGKTNLTLKCYQGYEHNFYSYEHDSTGRVTKENFNWPEVFQYVDEWLRK